MYWLSVIYVRSLSLRHAGNLLYFWESVYLRFVLGNSELRTLQTIAKGQSNDRRHGYVYTYPGSFQALAWNEFEVSAYNSVESKLLVLAIKASSKATSCGTSNDKAPAFLFSKTNLIVPYRSQWLWKRVTRSATHWQHKSNLTRWLGGYHQIRQSCVDSGRKFFDLCLSRTQRAVERYRWVAFYLYFSLVYHRESRQAAARILHTAS